MPVVRIYLPVGRRELEHLQATGTVDASPSSPRQGFAVTDELRSRTPGADVEELEYAAFADAVAASASARSAPGDRRVVAATDADPEWVSTGGGGAVSSVALVAPVPRSRIASFHVDEDRGVPDDGGQSDDLLWYDVTELAEVCTLLG